MLFPGGVFVLQVRSSVTMRMAKGNGTLSRMTVMEAKNDSKGKRQDVVLGTNDWSPLPSAAGLRSAMYSQ